jgi:hypothetical protein
VLGIAKDLQNFTNVLYLEDQFCIVELTQRHEKIFLCFMYLSPSSSMSFQEIFERLDWDSNHCVLIGDMNARVGKYQTSSITDDNSSISYSRESKDTVVNSRGKRLISYLTNSFLKILNGSCKSDTEGEFTFNNKNGSSVIDICLATRIISQFLDLEVLKSLESSHFPILVSLGEADYPINLDIPKVLWSPEITQNFQSSLSNHLLKTNETNIPLLQFNSSIISAAKTCGMISYRKIGGIRTNNYPQWFDSKCISYKKNANRQLRLFRASNEENRIEAKGRYLDARRSYCNLKKAKQTLHRNRLELQLSNAYNCSEFYKALKYFNARNVDTNFKEDVTPTQFQSFYSKLFSQEDKGLYVPSNHCTVDDYLDADFSFCELNFAISKLATKKAPGPDSIINELWRALDTYQRLILLDSINDMWRTSRIPDQLTQVVISPIFKKGDRKEASNYRPICLVNTSLKLITMLMANRLSDWCETNNKISNYQAAYRKGFGCETHVFTLNAILQSKVNTKNGRAFALFIDLSKAFDSVVHSRLWERLHNVGISSKFISFVKAMYANVKAKTRTSYGESEYFPLQKGVLQGESLSPKLFTIFMDEIVEILYKTDIPTLKTASEDIHLLLYADDIVLLASNALDMQRKIDVLVDFFNRNNLSVNLAKTKCVVFRRKKSKRSSIPVLMWGNEVIEVVDKYTYLGVTFHWNLNFSNTVDGFLCKARVAEKHLFDIFRRSKMKTFDSRIKLFDSLVRSVLLYCSPIWGLNHIESLVVFQNKFLRRLFNLPNKTPAWFLRLELNVKSLEIYVIKSALQFWKRIVSSNNVLLINSYKVLIENACKTYTKNNWYKSLRNVLKKWGWESLLEQVPEEGDLAELTMLTIEINKCIRDITNQSVSNDIVRMKNSTSMCHYQKIKTHCFRENYLNFNCNFGMVKNIIQLRANLAQISGPNKVVRLGFLNWFYDGSKDPLCKCCNLKKVENMFHVMFECPRYSLFRNKYLEGLLLPTSEENYAVFFQNITLCLAKSLSYYLKYMIILRNMVIE